MDVSGSHGEAGASETASGGREVPAGFEAVASVGDVAPGALLGVRLSDGTPVCLANLDGEILALHDCCSHQAFPLSAGELHEDGTVECTWHGALFDLHTGEPRKGPACDRVRTYDVLVQEETIHVRPSNGRA